VVSKVISRSGPMLGVLPDDRRDLDVSDMMALVAKPKH
jgi:cell division protein FtsI (penicillin-binding protein 3)